MTACRSFSKLWRWNALLLCLVLAAGCGGSGGGPSDVSPTSVTISGKVTFDRIPFAANAGGGLDPRSPIESPARGVVVEAISGASAIATATTNELGEYSLTVPSDTSMFIRVKAQMRKTGTSPTWDFRVVNNTNGRLYALDGSTFNSGTADSTRNLRAASGWTGTSYGETRAAAPFAILDTVYQAKELIHSVASVDLPALDLFWSPSNTPSVARFCVQSGDIGSTFYWIGGDDTDDCGAPVPEGIYILGNFSVGDTDEFDQHVIAHEFGHYIEDKLSRSDSIGGEHGPGEKLDLRVAFSEGWGNAFSGMVLNDSVYRDSFDRFARDFNFDLEQDSGGAAQEGWYSEASVGEILWDLFDAANESGDEVALGFGPILNAMTSGQRTTPALTSIFSFLQALREEVPSQSAAINQLRNGEQISGTDAFGNGENNNGGDALNLPVYRSLELNDPQQQPFCVRVSSGGDIGNKLGFSRFFRLDLASARTVTITVVGTADPGTPGSVAAQDPDIWVYRQGRVVAVGETSGQTEQLSQLQLSAGTYVIEAYDYRLGAGSTPRCMTIAVIGT
jgi:hypothetical protein